MNKKKKIIIGVLVALMVILGIVYWPKQGNAPAAPLSNGGQTSAGQTSTPPTVATSGYAGTSSTVTVPGLGGGITVTTTVGWGQYQSTAYGLTVSYPPGWQVYSAEPVVMNNFRSEYGPGDTLPSGGAEIDIMGTSASTSSLQSIIDTELMKASITSSGSVMAGGVSCKEIFYSANGRQATKNIAVYCFGKTLLYKVYLAYRADDPKGAAFVSAFKQVLGTLEFSK